MSTTGADTVANMIDNRAVVVCVGSGGVGKTTTAAALGIAAANRGKRVAVLTVDPAKRLAEALGLTSIHENDKGLGGSGDLDNRATPIAGPWDKGGGQLWGVMLDAGDTFDDLIREHAADEAQAEAVLNNRLYRNLTSSLSGTQEYMAAERLRSLHLDDRFDLVVVDTPPSQHALDLLDGPGRLSRFVDHRLYRSVLAPKKGLLKAWGAVTQIFVRTVSKVIGAELLGDVVDFFAAFDGMDDGFRDRATEIDAVLTGPDTAYVVVTAAREESIREARWLLDELASRDRHADFAVVNRMTPDFLAGLEMPAADAEGPLDQNLRDFALLRQREVALVDGLHDEGMDLAILTIDELDKPAVNIKALQLLAEMLAPSGEGAS